MQVDPEVLNRARSKAYEAFTLHLDCNSPVIDNVFDEGSFGLSKKWKDYYESVRKKIEERQSASGD